MANIFKTTLKKDIIADIADNGKREVRFPITKFWATRFADEFNLDEKTFEFKTFDSLEFSSPSNKDTISETCVFNYVRTLVDGDEFVIEFKDDVEEEVESSLGETMNTIDENIELDNNIPEEDDVLNTIETITETDVEETVSLDSVTSCDDNVEYWFYRKRLSSWDKVVCEFTLIENEKVIGFSDNLKMCKGVSEKPQ